MSSISRSALGRVAKLGVLYDARLDKFCGLSILKDDAPKSAIQTTDSPFSDTKFILSDKYSEKFDKLDVKADMKLSVLCGLLPLEGSGCYLRDQKSSKRAVRCTLMHSICTKEDKLNIFNDALKKCISLDALKQEATHVVTGIKWGANLMVTAEYTNEENQDTMQISGALAAQFNKLKLAMISGKKEADIGKGDAEKEIEFSLHIYGDVLPEGVLPQSIEEAKKLMRELPDLIKKSNDGKGKPLQYVLLPVDVLKSHFNVPTTMDTIVRELSEDAILRFVHFFDRITDAKQQLNDLYLDVLKHRLYLPESTRKDVEGLKSMADISESSIRSQLKELLVKVRKGRAEESELEELRMKYENDPNSAENILKQNNFDDISEKISTYQLLTTNHGVMFVPNTVHNLDVLLVQHFGKDVYILFSQSKAKIQNKSLWYKQLDLFLSLIQEHKPLKPTDQPRSSLGQQSVFLYVDLDITPRLAPQGNQVLVIQHFKNVQCIAPNLYEDHAKDSSICLVKSDAVVNLGIKPNERATLEIQCPSSLYGKGMASEIETLDLDDLMNENRKIIQALKQEKEWHSARRESIRSYDAVKATLSMGMLSAAAASVSVGLSFFALLVTLVTATQIRKPASAAILLRDAKTKGWDTELQKALESRVGVYNRIGDKILKGRGWIDYTIESAKLSKDVLTQTTTGIRLGKVMKFLAITAPEPGVSKLAFTFSHQGLAELEAKLRLNGLRAESNASKVVGVSFDIDTTVDTWRRQPELMSRIDTIVSCMECQLAELHNLRNELC